MENTDSEIEDFINEISPKTGGIEELARLKIKYFFKNKMLDSYNNGYVSALQFCKQTIFSTEKTEQ